MKYFAGISQRGREGEKEEEDEEEDIEEAEKEGGGEKRRKNYLNEVIIW